MHCSRTISSVICPIATMCESKKMMLRSTTNSDWSYKAITKVCYINFPYHLDRDLIYQVQLSRVLNSLTKRSWSCWTLTKLQRKMSAFNPDSLMYDELDLYSISDQWNIPKRWKGGAIWTEYQENILVDSCFHHHI